jgi:butyrate kinase
LRLQRAKIKIFAAQRKAARNQSEDHEEDLKRLEEMKDQIELLELENIITQQGPDMLSPEQVQRLGLLRYRELQQLRAMLS